MRQGRTVQASIFDRFVGHEIGRVLKAIPEWLDDHRELVGPVTADLRRQIRPRTQIRVSNFCEHGPGQPGITRRSGAPFIGCSGAPFISKAIRLPSITKPFRSSASAPGIRPAGMLRWKGMDGPSAALIAARPAPLRKPRRPAPEIRPNTIQSAPSA
jgi:hypothetical protein